MDRTTLKYSIFKYTVVFCVVYVLIWLFPGIVVYPANYLIELYEGVEYVDSWTPGMMVWAAAVIALPILFVLGILGVLLIARGKGHA
jgi:hypothetical protein